MKPPSVTSVAYPGLPLIFAEGYRRNRVSMHGHISIALTSLNGSVRTETLVEPSSAHVFLVDGKPLNGKRGAGMLKVRDALLARASSKGSLAVHSHNHEILSGSSDSGAAALAVALNRFLALNLSLQELHDIARNGSETAYRSLYGGLSEYYLANGKPKARCLLHAEELRDIVIYAIPFDYPRHSADILHNGVVKHPSYRKRLADVKKRIHEFKSHLVERDFNSCLQVVEDDARDVHHMFEEVGLPVRKELMLNLCADVERWRKEGLPCFWNVAGGSVVYVLTTKKHKNAVQTKLCDYYPREYTAAGPSHVL
jgi:mevalonate-3-kinase